MWQDKLKELGVNIHVIATGAGAGLQAKLWEVPGSSAYLSGASFPYSAEEQEDLLGFMPEHFCSEEAAIDLASAAYMKAYKFGGNKPVGVGITASVASEKIHRGEHHAFACVITNDKAIAASVTFTKATGIGQRRSDGELTDILGRQLLKVALDFEDKEFAPVGTHDVTQQVKDRFFLRPFFSQDGKRFAHFVLAENGVLFPGAFNPPHDGHFGPANEVANEFGRQVVFEVTAEPPHKDALTPQQLLQRAKLLQRGNRLFTRKNPYYLDKARAYPGAGLLLGADAMVRMLDPKWGLNTTEMLKEFKSLRTKIYLIDRKVDGKLVTYMDIIDLMDDEQVDLFESLAFHIPGEWDISSTEIRNKLL